MNRSAAHGPAIDPFVRDLFDARDDAEPSVATLLDVDREYRERRDRLPRITPRQFNPGGKARLPILHTTRGPWRFTALHSNTALAHRLRRTHDWVVIYFHAGQHPEGRRTVVTETRGELEGRRVVRGRETECPGEVAGQPRQPEAERPKLAS
jgi:hypothetical protein